MPAIGITGGVATGKSTFTQCLRELFTEGNEPGWLLQKITKETKVTAGNIPTARFFDADAAAREIVDLPEVKQELVREFGEKIFSDTGDLNRGALRAIVFQDAAKKRALEQILHPRIRRQWSALAETHRNSPDFFFADIPLLYETGGESLCKRVVVVACSRTIQLKRLLERKAIDQSQAEQMINSQMSLEEKIRRADHVVWNNGDRQGLMEQAKSLAALWQTD
ncbi:MAG: dephospho-CoA kinase [Verrucomicrobiota bacterium]